VSQPPEKVTFPPDFVWGAATASFQIEGAAREDGRGVSIWDTFCRVPGAVKNGDTGDVACDHYHRYQEDVALMVKLGLRAYRFSIAWPRILPQGTGSINQAGLDFYDRLVDALLEKNIEPYATIYHWDLPQILEDGGGWLDRSIVNAFVNYTDVVTRHLGDRVHNWITINEPWCSAFLGYGVGVHAPGKKDFAAPYQANHHLLLAHGMAVPVIRANGDSKTRVGIAINPNWVDSVSDSPEDVAAARLVDASRNRSFLDPLFKGEYPSDIPELYSFGAPPVQDGDMKAISTPLDFVGINFYNREVVGAGDGQGWPNLKVVKPEGEYTSLGWEVYPESLYNLLMRLHSEYGIRQLYMTENGAAYADVVTPDGHIHDEKRKSYLEGHIAQVRRAMADGAPVKGYFVWSLLDNFEWAEGYSQRFGLIHVDYETGRRGFKDSANWYGQVTRENGFTLSG
jgi:beta-glucosidase